MFHKELTDSDRSRLNKQMGSGEEDSCWEWKGTKDKHGYGIFTVGRKLYKAHRVAYFMHHKYIDPELMCCHSCDNPGCVNPDHLWLGTQVENMLDRDTKGRTRTGHLYGGDNPGAKLSETDVIWIRENYDPKIWSARKLARHFKVSQTKIRQILTFKSWNHI